MVSTHQFLHAFWVMCKIWSHYRVECHSPTVKIMVSSFSMFKSLSVMLKSHDTGLWKHSMISSKYCHERYKMNQLYPPLYPIIYPLYPPWYHHLPLMIITSWCWNCKSSMYSHCISLLDSLLGLIDYILRNGWPEGPGLSQCRFIRFQGIY